MKRELQDELFRKYPKIFRQKDLPMTQTCMCWGIDCGDGWYWLIDRLCAAIQNHIDHGEGKIEQVEAAQVKEKFGTLRFYVDGGDELVSSIISYSEYLSGSICEVCGATDGASTNRQGWMKTLCTGCRAKRKKSAGGDM